MSKKVMRPLGYKDTGLNARATDILNKLRQFIQTNLNVADSKQDADKLRSTFQATPDDEHFPSEKLTKDSLDEKVNKPTTADDDNIAVFDTDQDTIKDSGKAITDGDLVGTTDDQTLSSKTIDANDDNKVLNADVYSVPSDACALYHPLNTGSVDTESRDLNPNSTYDGTLIGTVLGATPTYEEGPFGNVDGALVFNGTDDYIDVGGINSDVKAVGMWIRTGDVASLGIMDIGSAHSITTDANGNIEANGFTTPTIYVNNEVAGGIQPDTWQWVLVTTDTGFDATTCHIGMVASTYFGGALAHVVLYTDVPEEQERTAIYKRMKDYFSSNNPAGTSGNFNVGGMLSPKQMLLQDGVYMDENFNPVAGRGSSAPDLINLDGTNIQITAFNGVSTLERVSGHAELNHNYKEGEGLSFHLHWSPTTNDAGDVKWQLEYLIADGDSNIVKAQGTREVVSSSNGVAWETIAATLGAPVTNPDFTIGDQVSCLLFRDPDDAADTYGFDAAVRTYGYHFQVDALGSREIGTK